ncbi:MAG: cytochrome c oxidase accessory protein CcoG [Pseudomonadota bacterium]
MTEMSTRLDTNQVGNTDTREEKRLQAAAEKVLPDVSPVNVVESGPLYAKRVKVQPKRVRGQFRTIKWVGMVVMLGVYYLLPWVRWDRGAGLPDQAVLVDFTNRKFYFFFIEIWPQEFYYITGLMILAALLLFLVTALAGRVWCGYACPQTVWTDLFILIEHWIEGDRNARLKLDKAPMSLSKLRKRISKHSIWLLIGVATGGAWVFYFANAPELAMQLIDGTAAPTAYVSIAVFTATTYMLGGLAREQVCTFMCPWPRIQGAMFDENSYLVSYKVDRGEPRGALKRSQDFDTRGDCIDCNQCVAVCPMGIDIRDGNQLECIQCALCIDACDDVMDKIDRPRGLIGYETIKHAQARVAGQEKPQVKLIRPRTVLYSTLIAIIGVIMLTGLITRADVDISIQKERNPIFVTLSDGSVRNGYTLRILNKAYRERRFAVTVTGLAGARLTNPLSGETDTVFVTAPQDNAQTVKLFVSLSRDDLAQLNNGSANLTFEVLAENETKAITKTTTFRGP